MGQALLKLEDFKEKKTHLTLVEDSFDLKPVVQNHPSISRSVIILGLILALIQIADGVLTGIGVANFGVEAEGNPLLKSLMIQIGYIPALIITKGLAIGIIGLLVYLSNKVLWIQTAMKAVIALYLVAAIIPWSYIITTRLLLS
jgi:hypothetical protein